MPRVKRQGAAWPLPRCCLGRHDTLSLCPGHWKFLYSQHRTVDFPAHADAEHRDPLISDNADDTGGGKPAEERDGLLVHQAVDGFRTGDDLAAYNDQDNDNAS